MSAANFKGKVVLVSGACTVLGGEIARHFSKLGASLVLTGGNKDRLGKVDKDCGGDCLVLIVDPSKNEDVLNIFFQTINKFKKLDVLINCSINKEPEENTHYSIEQFDHLMNLNVRNVYNLINLATPHLAKTKGNIVNVSNLVAVGSVSSAPRYNIAASAVDQLIKSSALLLAHEGVRLNNVQSGGHNISASPKDKNHSSKIFLGEPKDVCDVVLLLASESAFPLTGLILPVNGTKSFNLCKNEDHHEKKKCAPKQDENKIEKSKDDHQEADSAKREIQKGESSKQTSTKPEAQHKCDQGKTSVKQESSKTDNGKSSKHGNN